MEVFSLVFAALAGLLVLATLLKPSNRELWKRVRLHDLAVYGVLLAAGVVVSLQSFDTIGNHAQSPHEEALFTALRDEVPPDGWHPLETQVLIRVVFQQVGARTLAGEELREAEQSGDANRLDDARRGLARILVITSLALGLWGILFVGLAAQLLTERRWIGYGAAALMVLYPTLAYWRVHAFHVAAPQVAFAATLLWAVVVARKPDRLNFATWLVLGALCLFLRQEQVGAVIATAAIPLAVGPAGLWKRWTTWGPGLLLAGGLLGWPTWANMQAAAEREDYRVGFRFVRSHVANFELWQPICLPMLLLGLLAALWMTFDRRTQHPEVLRCAARGLLPIVMLGPLPAIFFTSFGQRHLLASGTAAALLSLVGIASVLEDERIKARRGLQRGLLLGCAVGMITTVVLPEVRTLQDWGKRYSLTDYIWVPPLAGTPTPEGQLDFEPEPCKAFAEAWEICDAWPYCHPAKDLTDVLAVRKAWDEHSGCVLWAVDESDGNVWGARHERWMVLRHLYDWEPAGIMEFMEGTRTKQIHIYRLESRP